MQAGTQAFEISGRVRVHCFSLRTSLANRKGHLSCSWQALWPAFASTRRPSNHLLRRVASMPRKPEKGSCLASM
jgi:hypothetical protein